MSEEYTKQFLEDQLCSALKDISPELLHEIKTSTNKLKLPYVIDYITFAHRLYDRLAEKNKEVTVVYITLKDHQAKEKLRTAIGEGVTLLKINAPGLEYTLNGKKQEPEK